MSNKEQVGDYFRGRKERSHSRFFLFLNNHPWIIWPSYLALFPLTCTIGEANISHQAADRETQINEYCQRLIDQHYRLPIGIDENDKVSAPPGFTGVYEQYEDDGTVQCFYFHAPLPHGFSLYGRAIGSKLFFEKGIANRYETVRQSWE